MILKDGQWKVPTSILAAILSVITIVSIIADGKISKHEAEFETKQQQTVTEIKTDIATLKERSESNQRQLQSIEEQGKHTQELVEQLIRDN